MNYRPLVFHFRNDFTVIILKEVDQGYRIGMAFCHPNDQFCRKIGRSIAGGRARLDMPTPYLNDILDVIMERVRNVNAVRPAYRSINTKELDSFIAHIEDVVEKVWHCG